MYKLKIYVAKNDDKNESILLVLQIHDRCDSDTQPFKEYGLRNFCSSVLLSQNINKLFNYV